MTPYLLDTNVLIALAWPNHVHHREALDWFAAKAAQGFRTCPITETGFVRISSNPSFSERPSTPQEAAALLRRITELPGYGFWADDLPLGEALSGAIPMATHRQVTDGYLLALAAAHGGILATLDRGILGLARRSPEHLEVILGRS